MNHKCKILFLVPSLAGGGAEKVLCTLLSHLDRKKFEPSLAVINLRDESYLSLIPQDIKVIDLKAKRVLFALPKITWLIWKSKPHIVFSNVVHLNVTLSLIKPLLPKSSRYIARESSLISEVLKQVSFPRLWEIAYKFFHSRLDGIIAQSQFMKKELTQQFGIDESKITLIYNPLDIDKIIHESHIPIEWPDKQPDKILTLVAAGRLKKVKGFDILIDAFYQLNNPNSRLIILGEGPLEEELKKHARKLNIETKVHFVGFKTNPYPYYKLADAFILSSRYENFPNVVLEALACGTPVIATPALGGIAEILNQIEGCLIATDITPEALASEMAKIEHNKNIPISAINKFSLENIIPCYEQEFLKHAAL